MLLNQRSGNVLRPPPLPTYMGRVCLHPLKEHTHGGGMGALFLPCQSPFGNGNGGHEQEHQTSNVKRQASARLARLMSIAERDGAFVSRQVPSPGGSLPSGAETTQSVFCDNELLDVLGNGE